MKLSWMRGMVGLGCAFVGGVLAAAASLPLPEPPPAEAPICFSSPPFSGIYGWPDDALSDYMAVVAELTPWEPPPRRMAILDGCVGFSQTVARPEAVEGSWIRLRWAGVRRCFDGWDATYGALGDRGIAFTFEAAGGCRAPVEAGPITLERIAGLKWSVESASDPREEVRRAALEVLLRDQEDPERCELLRHALGGYLRGEVPEPEEAIGHALRAAHVACLAPALLAAAGQGAWAYEGARALARSLSADSRASALIALVDGGQPGAPRAAGILAAYVPDGPELRGSLQRRLTAATGTSAAAARAALDGLGSR